MYSRQSRCKAKTGDAGKARNRHALPQESINHLLVRLAKEGKRVLRLKGGNPFIFGRGGEEIETLSSHRIPFQVVPSITVASAQAVISLPRASMTRRTFSRRNMLISGSYL